MKKRTIVLTSLLMVAAIAAVWVALGVPAQVLGSSSLDDVFFIRYTCFPDVGPPGDGYVDAAGTLDVQMRTSIYFINTTSNPIQYLVRYSGPDGIAGNEVSGMLPPGEAETIGCPEIAQTTGPQTAGEGYAFLRIFGGGAIASVTHSGYTLPVNGSGGVLTFQVKNRLQPERAGVLAFF